MPSRSFSEMIEILKKLVSFMNMTVSHLVLDSNTIINDFISVLVGFSNWS